METEIQLSVVMPIFNGVPFLKDSINDLLKQTYRNFELICVDDGSKDTSLDVIKYFAEQDSRIVVVSQTNNGAGYARNKGLSIAKGEFVLFLDCDDRYVPEFFEKMVQKAIDYSSDMVICDAGIFEEGTFLPIDNSWVLKLEYLPADSFSPEEVKSRLFNFTSGMPWNKLFRRSFILEENISFENIQYWNDTFFSFVLLTAAKRIAIVDEELVHYRTNRPGAITSVAKGQNIETGLGMMVSVKDELVRRKVYGKYWVSYVNFVMEKIIRLIRTTDENNYNMIVNSINAEYVDQFVLGELDDTAFLSEDYYKAYECLKRKGAETLIISIMAKTMRDAEWNYKKLFIAEHYTKQELARYVVEKMYPEITPGSDIVLCGMGNRGKRIYSSIQEYTNVVACVDKSGDESLGNIVVPYRDIAARKYDYVLITVDNIEVMKEIRNELVALGVNPEKIIW